ncbi:MAG: nucleoside hydrolase [Azospirillaceae bacterium]
MTPTSRPAPPPARLRLAIDTDPGLDDAVALLVALGLDAVDLVLVTSAAGNIGLDRATANARALLDAVGAAEVPLGRGVVPAGTSLMAAGIHGDDGLGGVLGAPPPVRLPDAAGLLRDTAKAGPMAMAAIAPLTNLAAWLDAGLRLPAPLAVMGGAIAVPGNAPQPGLPAGAALTAEFNFAADPSAAERVLAAGLDLLLVPLDVTRQVRADRAWTRALAGRSGRAPALAARLIEAYFRDAGARESRPLHDPLAVLALSHPGLFTWAERPLAVVTDPSAGQPGTCVAASDGRRPVRVALEVDRAAALALIAEAIAAAG